MAAPVSLLDIASGKVPVPDSGSPATSGAPSLMDIATGAAPVPAPTAPSYDPTIATKPLFTSPAYLAVTKAASEAGYDPRVIHAVVEGESDYNRKSQSTAGYYGLAQLGPDEVRKTGTDWKAYQNMDDSQQMAVAIKHWRSLGITPEMGIRGFALAQAAPGYLHVKGDPVIDYNKERRLMRAAKSKGYADANALVRAQNPGWVGPDGQIRPSSVTAYYARRMRGGPAPAAPSAPTSAPGQVKVPATSNNPAIAAEQRAANRMQTQPQTGGGMDWLLKQNAPVPTKAQGPDPNFLKQKTTEQIVQEQIEMLDPGKRLLKLVNQPVKATNKPAKQDPPSIAIDQEAKLARAWKGQRFTQADFQDAVNQGGLTVRPKDGQGPGIPFGVALRLVNKMHQNAFGIGAPQVKATITPNEAATRQMMRDYRQDGQKPQEPRAITMEDSIQQIAGTPGKLYEESTGLTKEDAPYAFAALDFIGGILASPVAAAKTAKFVFDDPGAAVADIPRVAFELLKSLDPTGSVDSIAGAITDPKGVLHGLQSGLQLTGPERFTRALNAVFAIEGVKAGTVKFRSLVSDTPKMLELANKMGWDVKRGELIRYLKEYEKSMGKTPARSEYVRPGENDAPVHATPMGDAPRPRLRKKGDQGWFAPEPATPVGGFGSKIDLNKAVEGPTVDLLDVATGKVKAPEGLVEKPVEVPIKKAITPEPEPAVPEPAKPPVKASAEEPTRVEPKIEVNKPKVGSVVRMRDFEGNGFDMAGIVKEIKPDGTLKIRTAIHTDVERKPGDVEIHYGKGQKPSDLEINAKSARDVLLNLSETDDRLDPFSYDPHTDETMYDPKLDKALHDAFGDGSEYVPDRGMGRTALRQAQEQGSHGMSESDYADVAYEEIGQHLADMSLKNSGRSKKAVGWIELEHRSLKKGKVWRPTGRVLGSIEASEYPEHIGRMLINYALHEFNPEGLVMSPEAFTANYSGPGRGRKKVGAGDHYTPPKGAIRLTEIISNELGGGADVDTAGWDQIYHAQIPVEAIKDFIKDRGIPLTDPAKGRAKTRGYTEDELSAAVEYFTQKGDVAGDHPTTKAGGPDANTEGRPGDAGGDTGGTEGGSGGEVKPHPKFDKMREKYAPPTELKDPPKATAADLKDPYGGAPVSFAEIQRGGETRVVMGMDPNLIKVLRGNLYKGDIGKVALKETVQNSVDAVRSLGKDGKVTVDFDTNARKLSIEDNGHGMLPEVVTRFFVDAGASVKQGASSGGYGIAKVAFLVNAEEFTVTTVARNAQGKMIQTILKGSGEDLVNAEKGISVETTELKDGAKSGTKLEIKFADEAKMDAYASQSFAESFVKNSKLDADVSLTINQVKQEIRAWHPATERVTTLKVPGAEIDFHISKASKRSSYPTVSVLNRGLPQFDRGMSVLGEADFPTAMIADVRPTVGVDSFDYPFTADREGLKDTVTKAIDDYVKNDLAGAAASKEQAKYQAALESGPDIGTVSTRHRAEPVKRRLKLVDATNDIPNEVLKKVGASPVVNRLADAMYDVTEAIKSALGRYDSNYLDSYFHGIAMSDSFLGVNIHGEYVYPGLDHYNAILHDPFLTVSEIKDLLHDGAVTLSEAPRYFAEQVVSTLLHEVTHQAARNEGKDFSGPLTRNIGRIIRLQSKLADRIEAALSGDDLFANGYQELVDLGKEISPHTTGKNLFSAISSNVEGHPSGSKGGARGSEAGGAGREPAAQPGEQRVSGPGSEAPKPQGPPAGIDPADWSELVDHAKTFVADGREAFNSSVTGTVGGWINPHLDALWDASGGKGAAAPPQPPAATGGSKSTGLANQVQEKAVARGEITLPEKGKAMNEQDAHAYGEKVLSQQADPIGFAEAIASDVAKKNRTMEDSEIGVFLAADRRFIQAIEAVPAADFGRRAFLRARRQAFLDNVQKGKTRLSNAFRALQAGSDVNTGSFEDVLQRAIDMSEGKLSPRQKRLLVGSDEKGGLVGELKKTQAELDKVKKAYADRAFKEQVRLLRLDEARAGRSAVRTERKAAIKDRRTEITTNIKAILNDKELYKAHDVGEVLGLGAKNVAKLTLEVGKLVATLVEEGALTLGEVFDKVKAELPPQLSDADIYDLISGQAAERKKPTLTDLQAERRRIIQEARVEAQAARAARKAAGAEDVGVTFRGEVDPTAEARSVGEARAKKLSDLQNRLADLEEQIRTKNYKGPKTREQAVYDNEVDRLQRQAKRLDDTIKMKIEAQKPKGALDHVGHFIENWQHEAILSGASVFGHLAGASAWTALVDLIAGDTLGYVAGQIKFRGTKLADIAGKEGEISARASLAGAKLLGREGFKDAWGALRYGHDAMGSIAGKLDREGVFGKLFARTHGATKAFLKRSQYNKSLILRTEKAARLGYDIENPNIQELIQIGAAKDALDAALQGHNVTADWLTKGIMDAQASKGVIPKTAGYVGSLLIPIKRIALNFAKMTFDYAGGGIPRGIAEQFMAKLEAARGHEITPLQADEIIRAYKRGAAGAVAIYLGLSNPDWFQWDDEDELSVFGVHVPEQLAHHPFIEAVHIWHKAAKAYAEATDPSGEEPTKWDRILGGGWEGIKSYSKKVPGSQSVPEFLDVVSGKQGAGRAAGRLLGQFNPQLIQQLAKAQDKDADGKTVRRKTTTFGEALQYGVPDNPFGIPSRRQLPASEPPYSKEVKKVLKEHGIASKGPQTEEYEDPRWLTQHPEYVKRWYEMREFMYQTVINSDEFKNEKSVVARRLLLEDVSDKAGRKMKNVEEGGPLARLHQERQHDRNVRQQAAINRQRAPVGSGK